MKNLWGIEVITPAPSPSLASEPTAPLCVMLQSRFCAVCPGVSPEGREGNPGGGGGEVVAIAGNLGARIALDMAME